MKNLMHLVVGIFGCFLLVGFSQQCHAEEVFPDQDFWHTRPSKKRLYPIYLSDRSGYIDSNGKTVFEFLGGVEEFSEDHALVTIDLAWVRVDSDGRIVRQISRGVQRWKEGKRSLPPKKEKLCFINANGHVVSSLLDGKYKPVSYLSDGV